jgi:hypothetical protein
MFRKILRALQRLFAARPLSPEEIKDIERFEERGGVW